MNKTKTLAVLAAVALSLVNAGGARAHDMQGSVKALNDSAQALEASDPSLASTLKHIAMSCQDKMSSKEDRMSSKDASGMLSQSDKEAIDRAAVALNGTRPDLSKKLEKLSKHASRKRAVKDSTGVTPGADMENNTHPDRMPSGGY